MGTKNKDIMSLLTPERKGRMLGKAMKEYLAGKPEFNFLRSYMSRDLANALFAYDPIKMEYELLHSEEDAHSITSDYIKRLKEHLAFKKK